MIFIYFESGSSKKNLSKGNEFDNWVCRISSRSCEQGVQLSVHSFAFALTSSVLFK